MTLPLISVIVPIYHVENYLRKCIDSILAQTYQNLEVILVDDGSPDNCGQICDEYASKHRNIRVIHQTNHGLSAARNVGLEMAKAEYIGFIDSDDYIEPDMYEYLYSLIIKDNANMSMCNICQDEGFHAYNQEEQSYELLPVWDIFKFRHGAYVWNKLYRRNFISNLRFNTTTSYGENGLFNFELAKSRPALVALGNQPKYHYRFNQNPNALTQIFKPSHLNRIVLMEPCLQYAKKHHLTTYYKMRSIIPLLDASKWLMQIALSGYKDSSSVEFLAKYIKKHLIHFVSIRPIPITRKLFTLLACIHFGLASQILRFYYFKIKKNRLC